MNTLVSVAVLLLQRVPVINQIPAIANAGTVDRAISSLNKVVAQLENVAAVKAKAAAAHDREIAVLQDARSEALAVADKAKKIAGNIGGLFN